MKKIFMLFAAILLIGTFSLTAMATDGYADSENTAEASEVADLNADDVVGEADSADNGSADETVGEENAFAALFNIISDYSSEILCAATLALTAFLSFAYKKGLLPLIKNALGAIGTAIGSVKESAERGTGALNEQGQRLIDSLSRAEGIFSAFEERLDELDGELSLLDDIKRTQDANKIIMRTQIDALCEIFMSSALPEYKKAALGEKITKMREALKDAEDNAAKT